MLNIRVRAGASKPRDENIWRSTYLRSERHPKTSARLISTDSYLSGSDIGNCSAAVEESSLTATFPEVYYFPYVRLKVYLLLRLREHSFVAADL
jgi:hypothetical protein